jgi:methylmalonyl-CoA/ethylmalonyl-CoA epimerase
VAGIASPSTSEVFAGFTFHHIGVACVDLDPEERAFEALGYARESDECVDVIQSVRARFLVGPGPRIELVADLQRPGPVEAMARKGVKMYHVAFQVDDLAAAARRLSAAGGKEIVAPVPGAAFGMRLLCFYALQNMTLVELISRT